MMRKLSAFVSLIGIAVVAGLVAADGYSPTALAAKKVMCTTKGKLSETCMEFWQDVVVGRNVLKTDRSIEDDLRACWREAKAADEQGEGRAVAAEKLLRLRASGDPVGQNKYVDECIRVTGEVMGGLTVPPEFRAILDRHLRD